MTRASGASVRMARTIALALMLSAAAASLWEAGRQWRVSTHEQTIRLAMLDGAGGVRLIDALRPCGEMNDPRQLLSCVSGYALLSRSDRSAVAEGERTYARLMAIAPRSGEGRIAGAMLSATGIGTADRARALDRLRESYAFLPYSRDAGLWRSWFVARHWAIAPADLRRSSVKEAVWFARLGYWQRQQVKAALGPTPAWVPISLRLIADVNGRGGPDLR